MARAHQMRGGSGPPPNPHLQRRAPAKPKEPIVTQSNNPAAKAAAKNAAAAAIASKLKCCGMKYVANLDASVGCTALVFLSRSSIHCH